MADLIERVECETAKEFLDVLSPRSKYFSASDPKEWVFRGHSDDRYELVPSALREKGNKLWEIQDRKLHTNGEQILAERTTLFNFFEHVDSNGLPIPEDSQKLRGIFDTFLHSKPSDMEKLKSGEEVWPPDEILSFVGLAQHYGIPTRLLDWSRSPNKAALFAAKDAASKLKSRDESQGPGTEAMMAVWAIAPEQLRSSLKMARVGGKVTDLVMVTAPRAQNPNLHAQEGLFSLCRPPKVKMDDPIDRRPMDTMLSECISTPKSPLMYRFVLPVAEAGRLLYLLAKDGLDSASLFPGYDGVVAALFDRRLWDRG